MSIYDYDVNNATLNLLPPNKRGPNNLAYMSVFGEVLQKYRDLFLDNYAFGSPFLDWVSLASYDYKEKVRDTDNAIYEVITVAGITGLSTQPRLDPTNWIKVINKFIGAQERAKYTVQRVVFEYALNSWFKSTFRQFTGWDGSGNPTPTSDIYIQNLETDNNSFRVGVDESESSAVAFDDQEQSAFIALAFVSNKFMFQINFPLAVYDALIPTDPTGITTEKDNLVRAFADNYVLGGVTYTIVTY